MAFEIGGYADKLGNRYEGRWIVKQILRLLKEEIKSLTIEAIGDDERGVDLFIERNDNTNQYQQCKARNKSQEYWSISNLNSKGVLSDAKFQLSRDPTYSFALVSGVSGTVIGDICESARNSNGNPEDFYKYQIIEQGSLRTEVFNQLCDYLGFDHDSQNDRAKIFDYLQRFHILHWTDDQNSLEELLGTVSLLIIGRPHTIIDVLSNYAQDNIRKRITSDLIWQHLRGEGFHPRSLPQDTRVVPAISKLQDAFEDSIKPNLIAGNLINRDETQELLKSLSEKSLIILHGSAGCGKTGVLYELTMHLKNMKIPFLPIRLDRQIPRNTTKQFGEDLGLPESPVSCLESVLSETGGILIIDQLDALRWTSSHSANSLDVCKSIIREAISTNYAGKRMSIVLSCRTFDLEHDPEIKNWLQSQSGFLKCQKIIVKELSEKTVEAIVNNSGANYADMTSKQKHILSSPHHLAMWVMIMQQGQVPLLHSGTQLMRDFWENRYSVLRKNCGINNDEINRTLDTLIVYMEREGEISAPESLVSDQQSVSEALYSYGILRNDGKRVIFCHQSYLDYRIADRLLRRIYQGGGDIVGWLGDRNNQSLFKREQLRQALVLLADENQNLFLGNIKAILSNNKVRFHIKHLTLEVLGQVENPSDAICDFVMDLLVDDYWKDHIRGTVLWKHSQYIKMLIQRKTVQEWLESDSKEKRDIMLWLLRSVSEMIPDEISQILAPFVERDDNWPQMILNCLNWNETDDSDQMFELRLQLITKGIIKEFVYWKDLCGQYPERTIQLIEAFISTCDNSSLLDKEPTRSGRRSRLKEWHSEDMDALRRAAIANPAFTWNMLMPHVERLTSLLDRKDYNIDKWHSGDLYARETKEYSMQSGIVEMMCAAGKKWASIQPEAFLNAASIYENSISPVVQEILMETYAVLSSKYADTAIQYLLADVSRFASGAGYDEPEWMPAVRLLKNQSPYCSDALFSKLENAIIYYHSPHERKDAEYWLTTWKQGYYGHYWGEAQYFLLPALSDKRRSDKVNQMIGVLKRKFASYSERQFLKGSYGTGGFVGSPIPSEKVFTLSDKTWLEIITNKKIIENRGRKWKQMGPDHVGESTVEHFANDLRRASGRFPDRFAKLALEFPDDVPRRYLSAILGGVKTVKPENMSDAEKAVWKPASRENIEAILRKYPLDNTRSVAHEFCWLMHDRADEKWSDGTINKLIDYAINHPDLEEGKLNIRCDESSDNATVDDLVQNSINCVRGVAAIAIEQVLWNFPDKLEQLKPTLIHLTNDPHPAVRIASLRTCRPLLKYDKSLAVEMFLSACKNDLRVAASRYAVEYFNHCFKNYSEKLSLVIIDMLNSEIAEVAEEGAKEVCARWMFHGAFKNEFEWCKNGMIPHRKGLAEVASFLINEEVYTDKCIELLLYYYDDDDEEVRKKASHAYYNKPKLLTIPSVSAAIKDYISSQAFRDDPTGILFTFEEYEGSLLPFSSHILNLNKEFSGPLKEATQDIQKGISFDVSMLTSLVLRLYEQGKSNEKISGECLDMWDMLFENRIGYVRDLTKAIDS